jgi:hypothetical protein
MSRKLPANLGKISAAQRVVNARCDEWAAKAVRYRQEGDWRKAERAESRAFRCLQRMKQLKDRAQLFAALGAINTT